MKDRRGFTQKFKLAAVKKVLEKGLTVTEVAKEFGFSDTLNYN